jgi:hypothetical protein
MNDSFKKGFEKNAGLLTLLGGLIMPSVQKRVGADAFEYSKRKKMGLDVKENKVFDVIHKQIEKAENIPDGTKRKKIVDFAMNEGPGIAVYMPSQQGKKLGETLNKFTKSVPFGLADKDEVREFLARLTSADAFEAERAAKELTKKVNKAKGVAKTVGMGALGSLGAYLAFQMANKKGQPEAARIPQELHSSSSL